MTEDNSRSILKSAPAIGTIAGVTDGTSNTVAFFERLRGRGEQSAKQGNVWAGTAGTTWGMPSYILNNPADTDYLNKTVIPECQSQIAGFIQSRNFGNVWQWGGLYWAGGT